LWKGAAEIWL